MTETIYDGLPTFAQAAFDGKVAEPTEVITEADLHDAEVESDLQDREDWASQDEPSFDDAAEDFGPPSRTGFDFGDEDAIFGRGL